MPSAALDTEYDVLVIGSWRRRAGCGRDSCLARAEGDRA